MLKPSRGTSKVSIWILVLRHPTAHLGRVGALGRLPVPRAPGTIHARGPRASLAQSTAKASPPLPRSSVPVDGASRRQALQLEPHMALSVEHSVWRVLFSERGLTDGINAQSCPSSLRPITA